MLVSVIVVTYNSVHDIAPCLDALFVSSHVPIEVIICDNASTDGTTRFVAGRYPDVRILQNAANLGFASACNLAATIATGEYLAFLNPDTVVEENWIRGLLDVIDAEADVGAVTPMIVLADTPHLVNACGNNVHLSGIAYCRDYGRPRYAGPAFQVGAISGAAFALRRGLFEELGGFEDRLFLYYEDTDLSLRLHLAGYRCLAVPESRVRHRYHGGFGPSKIYHLERNRYLTLLSLVDSGTLGVMLPSMALMELVVWGYCTIHGVEYLAAKVTSWRDVIGHRRWISDRRRRFADCRRSGTRLVSIFTDELRIEYARGGSTVLPLCVEFAARLIATLMIRAAFLFGFT